MNFKLTQFRSELETELKQEILPWWGTLPDFVNGGFPGLIHNDGSFDSQHDRGVVMHARFLWTYAAAYRRFHDETCLPIARHALAYLTGALYDHQNSGFHWQISWDGQARFQRKVVYGQAFAIYALAEWYRATGEVSALDLATATFDQLQNHAGDPEFGGYYEACSMDWSTVIISALSDVDQACAKSMNTNLHVMEALSNLVLALRERPLADNTRHDRAQSALRSLIDVHLDHIRITSAHFGLFFNRDWSSLEAPLSYGHDIEGSWLITEAAEIAWNGVVPARVREAALTMARRTVEIIEKFGPGLINESHHGHVDTERIWWVQAECLVGLLNAAVLDGDPKFIQQALAIWDYIKKSVKDPIHGEWFWSTLADGSHSANPKGGLWKTSYHNGRACMEGMDRLDQLITNKGVAHGSS